MVDNHVIEYETGHDEIVLWWLDLNVFDENKKGIGREGSSDSPY